MLESPWNGRGWPASPHSPCCSSTPFLHPPVVHKPQAVPASSKRNSSTGHQAKTKLPPLWHTQLSHSSPGLFSFPGIPLVSAAPALSSCVQCFNEVHSTDIKGASTTLLNLFLLGASKSCFSRSLGRCIKSPAPIGKQCPFLDWHHQSNQQRHLRTGCTILENEITLKRFLLAYLPANDRTSAKHSQSVLGCSERQSLCRDIFFFLLMHLNTSHALVLPLTWAWNTSRGFSSSTEAAKFPMLHDQVPCFVSFYKMSWILHF